MYNYSNNGITVASILDDRRPIGNGCYPVKVRVTYKRIRKYYPTGKNLSLEDWAKLLDAKSKILIATRSDIQYSFEKVRNVVQALEQEDKFSFDALNVRLGKGNSETINIAFRTKIENLVELGAIGNSEVYTCAINRVERFGGERISFDTITSDWLKRFEKDMLDDGRSYTTISIYMRCIRAIFNEAISCGVIKQGLYPFGKKLYEIPSGKGRKLALTLAQIKSIIDYNDGSDATACYRDLWFFSYLTNGINVSDMLKLKYSYIVNDEICFYRSKTINTSREKKEIRAILTPESKKIIEHWGNPDRKPENHVFPYLTGKETPIQQKKVVQDITHRINKRLKKIGKELGIDGLTTYTARHMTCCFRLKTSNLQDHFS